MDESPYAGRQPAHARLVQCPNVFETQDTAPPLSTPRRNTVGLTITGAPPLPPPPLPQMPVSAPALGVPGFVMMIGSLVGLVFLRLNSQRKNTKG